MSEPHSVQRARDRNFSLKIDRLLENPSQAPTTPAEGQHIETFSRRRFSRLSQTRQRTLSANFTEAAVSNGETQQDATKLGTFDGVFMPTVLNVLSILMFLRFEFIIGQTGLLGSLGLLLVSYAINFLTIMSLSAIATNGVVKGGGAYYMISRSLGPEFGGSIGVIFYFGQVFNAGLNVVGFCEPLVANFGAKSGELANFLPESATSKAIYETMLLLICTGICLVGPSLFARSSRVLFYILVIATVSVPVSAIFVKPYFDSRFDAWYTGPSLETLRENLLPKFTRGAAGSDSTSLPTFRELFGIFFPATAGIFAGASMSGDLKSPSRSIPVGTVYGTGLTFFLYMSVIVTLCLCCSRDLIYGNSEIMRDSSIHPLIIVMGEFSTSLFSSLMGIIGAAKLLQAIARDEILPGLKAFGRGKGADDNPILAIVATYVLTQITIFLDINQIAIFITIAFLLTFVVMNLACFLLSVSSATNFRPSFRYFNSKTALLGSGVSILAMYLADGSSSALSLSLVVMLFALIHYYSPPKPWGDVSQVLIYHQVRKYLLRLRQDNVKYWRPQILLFVDDPRRSWGLIKFCSHLKKGGLFILGHVIVVKDFKENYSEIVKQRSAWTKLRDACKIKAFVQISADVDFLWGVRNLVLGSGLGGMSPNIAVIGFFEKVKPTGINIQDFQGIEMEALPTDSCRKERQLGITHWVSVVEDLMTMKINVAVARGFVNIEIPTTAMFHESALSKQTGFVDLYPIQMSARLVSDHGRNEQLSINFDTYALILQLGAVLHTVPAWKQTHKMRVVAFVEFEEEVEAEQRQIDELLQKLRIRAQVIVKPLEHQNYVYEVIAKGQPDTRGIVDQALADSKWWADLKRSRQEAVNRTGEPTNRDTSSLFDGVAGSSVKSYKIPGGLSFRRREKYSSLQQIGVAHSMQSTRHIEQHLKHLEDSEQEQQSARKMRWNGAGTDSSMRSSHRYQDESDSANDDDDNDSGDSDNSHDDYSDDQGNETAVADGPDFVSATTELIDEQDDRQRVWPGMNTSNTGTSRNNSTAPSDDLNVPFNELPAKAQHLILNNLIKETSYKSNVIFTTLPEPAPGTCQSEKASQKYFGLLETLCHDLPPTVLIHAQSLTVTTAL